MKFLDLTGLNKFWDKLKGYFAKLNLTYGRRGYITGEGSNPDLLLEKLKLGIIQLYQGTGVGVKLYEYDAGDEANAVLVWDSSTLTGDSLQKFLNGQNLGTIYTSTAGKCIKAEYNGHTSGNYYYCRAFGIFMTPKQADTSHKATAVCRINGVDYASYTIDTYGGLVTAVCPDANYTTVIVKFTPSAATTRMRFYGFRCLNTYDGVDAVLLGRATSALSATKATQDSDGNAINATYFKANTGTTTLQSGTAVKVGTQNGADVKLQLPTIPAAANNGALKIGLNGGTATSKFTANQSEDSTLTFASGTTAGTINVDGTEVAVAGWSDKQDAMFVKFNFDSTLHYADVATALYAGKTPYLLDGRTMFVCDGSAYTVEVSGSTTTEYRFVAAVGNDSSPRIVYRYVRADNTRGSQMIRLATYNSVSSLESVVTDHNKFFHTETLNVTDGITRFLKISFFGSVGRASAIVLIGANKGNDSSAFRLSWFYDGTNPIGNLGRELFSVGDVNKKPLVYYDNNSFYIGLSDAGKGATISVMLACENPNFVSYDTVTRAVATGSGKTNLPLEWFAVYSKTISTIVKDTVIGNDLNAMYII